MNADPSFLRPSRHIAIGIVLLYYIYIINDELRAKIAADNVRRAFRKWRQRKARPGERMHARA